MKPWLGIIGAATLAACGPEAGPNGADPGKSAHVDCCATVRLIAPDGTRTLIIEPDGAGAATVRVSAGWLKQMSAGTIRTPADASWAPDGEAFLINDGQGAGRRVRLFRVPDNTDGVEDVGLHDRIVGAYRSEIGCPPGSAGPEVRGIGWGDGGRQLHAVARSVGADACGSDGQLMVMTMRVRDGVIVERLDAAAASLRFADLRRSP